MDRDGIVAVTADEVAEQDGYAAPATEAAGAARGRMLRPPGSSLWAVRASLGPGTTLTWRPCHGDEAVYVVTGRLEAEGAACTRRGVIVVESDVPAVVRASEPTDVIHVGPVASAPPTGGPLGAAAPAGHGVHVLDETGIYRYGEPDAGAVFYADSACPTCRLTLHRDVRPPVRVGSHTHSEDELIYMLSGRIQLGGRTYTAGDVVVVAALRRYGFRSDSGFEFLNYRRDASFTVGRPGSEPMLETVDHIRALDT